MKRKTLLAEKSQRSSLVASSEGNHYIHNSLLKRAYDIVDLISGQATY
jgi:hypothetical protein